jgi:anti-anti-sigma regulatory factor
MLRITARVESTETVLELEGKLTGLWTKELQRCWEKWLIENRPVRVLLKAVTFIDLPGKMLLARMHRTGTALEGEGCMTRAIIEAITGGERT